MQLTKAIFVPKKSAVWVETNPNGTIKIEADNKVAMRYTRNPEAQTYMANAANVVLGPRRFQA